jgi:hypothetical protein
MMISRGKWAAIVCCAWLVAVCALAAVPEPAVVTEPACSGEVALTGEGIDAKGTRMAVDRGGPARFGGAFGWFNARIIPPTRVITTRWTTTPPQIVVVTCTRAEVAGLCVMLAGARYLFPEPNMLDTASSHSPKAWRRVWYGL